MRNACGRYHQHTWTSFVLFFSDSESAVAFKNHVDFIGALMRVDGVWPASRQFKPIVTCSLCQSVLLKNFSGLLPVFSRQSITEFMIVSLSKFECSKTTTS